VPTTEVKVTVINPLDDVIVAAAPAISLPNYRWMYELTTVDMSGVWQVVWQVDDTPMETQTFTVGPPTLAGMTAFEARVQAVRRVEGDSVIGRVTDVSGETFIDETLLGGKGNYVGWWVLINEKASTLPRRVRSFSGSGMVVAPAFSVPPPPGTRYLLSPISPDEVDIAMRTAVSEVSDIARIEVHVPNIPLTTLSTESRVIQVPRGITHVHSVSVGGLSIPLQGWNMQRGRQLNILGGASAESGTQPFAAIIGIRPAGFSVWEDSILDFDSGTIIARVASLLHASRAGGQGADIDEHLRRQLAAMDEYQNLRSRAVGRPYPGSRLVID
jgi:hypothetical protein